VEGRRHRLGWIGQDRYVHDPHLYHLGDLGGDLLSRSGPGKMLHKFIWHQPSRRLDAFLIAFADDRLQLGGDGQANRFHKSSIWIAAA